MNSCPHCSAVEIEAVLDRSGSMAAYIQDAIGGFNAWLASQQAIPGAANLTLTLFDHEHDIVVSKQPLADVAPLNSTNYVPRGSTALNDAMGRALCRLEARAPAKAILVVLTDGQENCSREFTNAQIKAKVEAAQGRGWQVVYLSADINGFAHGTRDYGVLSAATMQMDKSGAGLRGGLTSASALNASYRGMPSTPAQPDPYQQMAGGIFVATPDAGPSDNSCDTASSSTSDAGACSSDA